MTQSINPKPAQTIVVSRPGLMRQSLRATLNAYPEIAIIATAGDGLTALHQVMQYHPALLVIDSNLLDEEVEAFIGAGPYQRTSQRRDHRNGTYPRDLGTGIGVIEALPVPRTRKGFRTQVFERYHRRRAELDRCLQRDAEDRHGGR